MSRLRQQLKRERYYQHHIEALQVMARRLGLKVEQTHDCDECSFGNGRHWRKPPHGWSFFSISHFEDGVECAWAVCGWCLPERYRVEMSGHNYWSTREADRRLREYERAYQRQRRR